MTVMMATPDEAASAFFGSPSGEVSRYVEDSVNQYLDRSQALPETIRSQVMASYQNFQQSHYGRRVEALRYKVAGVTNPKYIHALHDVGEVQQAPQSMKRWIMAMPEVRSLYQEDRCRGYGSDYTDWQPEVVGAHHYDYRRMMDGMVQYDPASQEAYYANYYERLIPDDVALSSIEKASLQMTREVISGHLDEGGMEDPTDEWNGLLK